MVRLNNSKHCHSSLLEYMEGKGVFDQGSRPPPGDQSMAENRPLIAMNVHIVEEMRKLAKSSQIHQGAGP
jgi:hypothetical protein